MNVLDFEINLEQSENIELDHSEGTQTDELKTVSRIFPFERKVVAKVVLGNNWKLKSKFKLTMNVPDRDRQYSYIADDDKKLDEYILKAKKNLFSLPTEIMSREDIEKELMRCNTLFIDLDFLPNDEAMVNAG